MELYERKNVKFLIFDIGKVIALGDERPAFDLLQYFGVKLENIKETFLNADYYKFLRGQINAWEFYNILVTKYFKYPLSYEQVVLAFKIGMFGIDHDVIRILSQLERNRIAFLTDTHVWHEEKLAELINLKLYSDHIFMSHKMGLVKIDSDCFTYVIRQLNINPCNALLIDDSLEKVEMAQRYGLQTLQFRNADQLSSHLRNIRWLR